MSRFLRLAGMAVVVAACGGGGESEPAPGAFPDDALVVRASTDLAVGTDRVLLGVATPDNRRLARPDIAVTIAVSPEEEPDAIQRAPGTFIWAIPEVSGLYRAEFEFDRPGTWRVQVLPDVGEAPESSFLQVNQKPFTPAVGTAAPGSVTPTSRDVADLAEITTDRDPDPRFYELSIADAVNSGRPSVITFATPRFCQTAVCGPTLDGMKAIADDLPGVNWLHVEVYTNLDDPDNLQVVPAATEWGLTSEPWVFVVDEAGIVAGRFEGVVDRAEIEAALSG